jgi:hypothetical protein
VITDRANGLRQRIVFVLRQAADVVVRFTPHNLPLQEASGKALDVVRWLKGCHAPAGRVVSREVWISYQGQQFAVRCIGLRLSEEQRKAAQRRKQRTASKKQQQVQADTLYLAGWVLLITTLQSRALECATGAALVSSALAHRAGRRNASNSYCSNTTCAVPQRRRPYPRSQRSCWDGLCRKKRARPFAWRCVMRCSAPKPGSRGGFAGTPGHAKRLVAGWTLRSPERMDGGRSQPGSLASADSRPLFASTVSGVFTAVATLSLRWASQKAPSLQPDLPLAGDANDGLGRASEGLMTRCHLGEEAP